jgi:GxxExxY protein
MNANERESDDLDSLVESVVGAAYEVSNVLGAGFLEKVYERALLQELAVRGLKAKAQAPFSILYKGHPVGDYLADILVEDRLIIELKCVDQFSNEHIAQCINYLKASGKKLALLINFQKPKMEWKRIVYKL